MNGALEGLAIAVCSVMFLTLVRGDRGGREVEEGAALTAVLGFALAIVVLVKVA